MDSERNVPGPSKIKDDSTNNKEEDEDSDAEKYSNHSRYLPTEEKKMCDVLIVVFDVRKCSTSKSLNRT